MNWRYWLTGDTDWWYWLTDWYFNSRRVLCSPGDDDPSWIESGPKEPRLRKSSVAPKRTLADNQGHHYYQARRLRTILEHLRRRRRRRRRSNNNNKRTTELTQWHQTTTTTIEEPPNSHNDISLKEYFIQRMQFGGTCEFVTGGYVSCMKMKLRY